MSGKFDVTSFFLICRHQIVYARQVLQTELIHASAKEIDCIFKVQVVKTKPLDEDAKAPVC